MNELPKSQAFRVTTFSAWIGLLFLLLPLIVIVPVSFTPNRWLSLPGADWSLQHYADLISDPTWRRSALDSSIVAFGATFAATTLGTVGAIGCWRVSSGLSDLARALMLVPIVVPSIVDALGFYQALVQVHLTDTYSGLIIAHTMKGIPYVVISVSAALANFDLRLEQAARGLGANMMLAVRRVVLPSIWPGVMAGAFFAFITSWDELVINLFIAGRRVSTLPRRIWTSIQDNIDPAVASVATLLMLVTLCGILAYLSLERRNEALGQKEGWLMFQHASGSIGGIGPADTPLRGGALHLDHVSKSYGSMRAVDDVSIALERGEFVTLLGPSGSGKTTLLMMIAGFVAPTNGEIRLDGKNVTSTPPEDRNLGMVFQGYALFPHMTVAGNIAFPLEVRKMSKTEIDSRVRQVLEQVQLGSLGGRYPRQLSGGQQQRVALARALVFMPDLLLLDEPLSALDRKLRADVQLELKALHRRLGLTFIYVTHDQEEALSMSDRVVVLRNGRIVQQGTPSGLYERPRTRFVADFLGKSNFLSGVVEFVRPDGFSYRCGEATLVQTGETAKVGSKVLLALRPEKIEIVGADRKLPNRLVGTLVNWSYTGAAFHLLVNTRDANQISLTVPTWRQATSPEVGAEITIGWDSNAPISVEED